MRRILALVLGLLAPLPAIAGWGDEVLYFVMVDRFADGDPTNNADVDPDNPLAFQGGDLAGLTGHLDEIASLGATAVWLTPVVQQIDHPIDSNGVPFYPHHGYWANDFNSLDARYGTEADLKALVDNAHDLGLKVVLDVVYNHVGYGADWELTHRDWLRLGAECGADEVTKCLAGLPDIRTERADVRDYLFEAHIRLAKRVGLDGFRLDTVKHIDHAFWAAHAQKVRAELGPDFLLLGEVWDGDKYLARPYLEAGEMDALFDFGFRNRTLKFLQGIEVADRYARYLAKRHDVPGGTFLAPFLSNHDMPMMLALLRGDTQKLRLGLTLLFTVPGLPVLNWGEEVGRKGGVWPDNRGAMPWGAAAILPGAGLPRDEALREDTRALIALRRSLPALRGPDLHIVQAEGGLLAYTRGADLLVVLRRDTGSAFTGFPPGQWLPIWSTGAAQEPPSATIYQRQ